MFKKLFKKDTALGDGDVKIILLRLGKLSNEDKVARSTELEILADTHADVAVRTASIDMLSSFDSLCALLDHKCAETAQCAAAKIARDPAFRKNLTRFPKLLEFPHVQYSMLQYATTLEQAQAHVSPSGSHTGLNLVALCLDCISEDVRQWLATQLGDLALLHELEKASRNRNKKINRFARQQIAGLKTFRDQLKTREQECDRLHTSILAIIDNELNASTSPNLQKAHLLSARLNTFRKNQLALKTDNQEALNVASTLMSDSSDTSHLAELHNKLESSNALLEQATRMLDEQVAEQTAKEQADKEQANKEPEVTDPSVAVEVVKKPILQENHAVQLLCSKMLEQETKNTATREQLENSKPSAEMYQKLWSTQSTSQKLSKQAQSLNKNYKKHTSQAKTEVFEQLIKLSTNLDGFIEYGNTVREALITPLTKSFKKLDDLISSGNMKSAAGVHADCKNKIRLLPHHTQNSALAQFKNIDKRYNELNDWRSFAATPKQVELCEAVEQLADNTQEPLEPEVQAEQLKTLRKQWQKLGRANRMLNKRFDEAADRAFTPCQIFFDEQNRIRRDNLDKRKSVLVQLRTFVEQNDWSNSELANWKAVEKILRTARSEWNSYLPIDRGKLRPAQKSFDKVCDQIHQKLVDEWKKNLDQKQAYLDRARALVSAEGSLSEILNEAKSLQVSWRNVGITPRAQDQRLWREFRKQSDRIFTRRDEEKKKSQQQRKAQNAELQIEYEALSSNVELFEKTLSEQKTSGSGPEADLKPLFSAHRGLLTKMAGAPRSMADAINKLDVKLKQLDELVATSQLVQNLDTLKALDMQIADLESNIVSGTISKPEDLLDSWQELAAGYSKHIPEKQFLKLENACKQRVNDLHAHCTQMDANSLQKLFETAQLAQTKIVVLAEIEAGVESAKADEQLRMQMQVERLKSGLANRQVQSLNPEHMALEWCATQSCGPARKALSIRYFSALAALL